MARRTWRGLSSGGATVETLRTGQTRGLTRHILVFAGITRDFSAACAFMSQRTNVTIRSIDGASYWWATCRKRKMTKNINWKVSLKFGFWNIRPYMSQFNLYFLKKSIIKIRCSVAYRTNEGIGHINMKKSNKMSYSVLPTTHVL